VMILFSMICLPGDVQIYFSKILCLLQVNSTSKCNDFTNKKKACFVYNTVVRLLTNAVLFQLSTPRQLTTSYPYIYVSVRLRGTQPSLTGPAISSTCRTRCSVAIY